MPLALGRDHVLLADLVQKGVLGEHGQGGEAADDHGRDRQADVPEVVSDLAQEGKFGEIRRGQAAQGKPVQIAAPGKEHDEQDGEKEAGDGVAHDHHGAGPHVEARAVAHGLAYAQGDGDHVDDDRGPQPQGNGHGKLVDDQVRNPAAAKKTFAEVKESVVPYHEHVAREQRLVEAVEFLDGGDELRIQPLRATVFVGGLAPPGILHRGVRARAADALHARGLRAFQAGDELVHGATRSHLHDEKVHGHDAQ